MTDEITVHATGAWHKHNCPTCSLDWTCYESDCRPTEQNKVCYDCAFRARMKKEQESTYQPSGADIGGISSNPIQNYLREKMRF